METVSNSPLVLLELSLLIFKACENKPTGFQNLILWGLIFSVWVSSACGTWYGVLSSCFSIHVVSLLFVVSLARSLVPNHVYPSYSFQCSLLSILTVEGLVFPTVGYFQS